MSKLMLVLCMMGFFATGSALAQTPCEAMLFCQNESQARLEELKSEYMANKTIPEEYQLQALIALSYYPELKNETIEFVFSKGAYSMAARPAPLSLFGSRKNRVYRVFINTESRNQGLLLSQVPFNGQVGVIGHELAHVLYYTRKSSFDIICNGLGYASKKFRANFEKATDQVTIDRGLGWQLLEFCSHTHESDQVPAAYKAYKANTYMTPEGIRQYILKSAAAITDLGS